MSADTPTSDVRVAEASGDGVSVTSGGAVDTPSRMHGDDSGRATEARAGGAAGASASVPLREQWRSVSERHDAPVVAASDDAAGPVRTGSANGTHAMRPGSKASARATSASWRQKLKELEDSKSAVRMLSEQLEQMRAEQDGSQTRLAELERAHFTLAQQNAELLAALEAERSKTAAAAGAAREAGAHCAKAEERADALERELRAARGSESTAQHTAEQLAAARAENARAAKELQDAREALRRAEADKQETSSHFWAASEEVRTLRTRAEEDARAKRELGAAVEAAKAEAAEAQRALQKAGDDAAARLQKAQDQAQASTAELARIKDERTKGDAAATRQTHQLKRDVARLTTDLDARTSELADALAQNEEMQQQMDEFLRRADTTIEEQKAAMATLTKAQKTTTDEHKQALAEHKAAVVQIRAEAQKVISQKDSQINVLTANLAAGNKKTVSLEKDAAQLRARVEEAESAARASVTEHAAATERLRAQETRARAEIDELECKLAELRTAAKRDADAAAAEAKRADALSAQLEAADAQSSELRERLSSLEKQHRAAASEAAERAGQLESELKAAREGLQAEREHHRRAAAQHKEVVAGLEADKRDLILEANSLNKELGVASESLKAAKLASSRAEEALASSRAATDQELAAMREEVKVLAGERDKASSKAAAAGERLVEALREGDEAKAALKETKKELASQALAFSDKARTINEDAEHWSEQARAAEAELGVARKAAGDARAEAARADEELRRVRSSLKEEADAWKQEADEAKLRLEDQNAALSQLQRATERLTKDLDAARTECEALKRTAKSEAGRTVTLQKQAEMQAEAAAAARREAETARDAVKDEVAGLQQQVRDLQAELVERDAARHKLGEQLTAQVRELQAALAAAQESAQAQGSRAQAVSAAHHDMESRMQSVQKAAQATINGLVEELKAADRGASEERERLQRELEASQSATAEVRRELKRVIARESDALEAARRDAAQARDKIEALEGVVASKEAEIDRVDEEANVARADADAAVRRADAAEAEKKDLEDALSSESNEQSRLSREWKATEASLRATNQASAKRIAELTSELTSLRHSAQWRDTETGLKSDALQKEAVGLRDELARRDAEVRAAEARVEELRRGMQAMQVAANESMEALRRELTEQSTATTEQLEAARGEVSRAKERSDELARALRHAEATERSLRGTIERLEGEIRDMRNTARTATGSVRMRTVSSMSSLRLSAVRGPGGPSSSSNGTGDEGLSAAVPPRHTTAEMAPESARTTASAATEPVGVHDGLVAPAPAGDVHSSGAATVGAEKGSTRPARLVTARGAGKGTAAVKGADSSSGESDKGTDLGAGITYESHHLLEAPSMKAEPDASDLALLPANAHPRGAEGAGAEAADAHPNPDGMVGPGAPLGSPLRPPHSPISGQDRPSPQAKTALVQHVSGSKPAGAPAPQGAQERTALQEQLRAWEALLYTPQEHSPGPSGHAAVPPLGPLHSHHAHPRGPPVASGHARASPPAMPAMATVGPAPSGSDHSSRVVTGSHIIGGPGSSDAGRDVEDASTESDASSDAEPVQSKVGHAAERSIRDIESFLRRRRRSTDKEAPAGADFGDGAVLPTDDAHYAPSAGGENAIPGGDVHGGAEGRSKSSEARQRPQRGARAGKHSGARAKAGAEKARPPSADNATATSRRKVSRQGSGGPRASKGNSSARSSAHGAAAAGGATKKQFLPRI